MFVSLLRFFVSHNAYMAWYVVFVSIWCLSCVLASLLRLSKRQANFRTYFLLTLSFGLCYMKALSHWLPYCSSTLFDVALVLITVGVYPTVALREAKERWQEAGVYLGIIAMLGVLTEIGRSLLLDTEGDGGVGGNLVKGICVTISLAAYACICVLQGVGVFLYPEEMLKPLLAEFRLAAEYRSKYEDYQEQIRSLLLYYTYRGMPMPAFKEKQFNELSLKADQFREEASNLLLKTPMERLAMYLRVVGGILCSVLCVLLILSYFLIGLIRVIWSSCGAECGFRYTGLWSVEAETLMIAAAALTTVQVMCALAGFVAWMGRNAEEDVVQIGMAGVVGLCGLGMPSAIHNLFPLLPGSSRSSSIQLIEFSLQWVPLVTVFVCGWSRRCSKVPL